ncbi:MAG: acyl-CoA dehydratase activase-related protein [Emergencia sp.]
MQQIYAIGIDVGSTTVKAVVMDENNTIVYAKYQRHFAKVKETLQAMMQEILTIADQAECTAAITGSGGLSLAEALDIEFVQEVIADTAYAKAVCPETDVIIELGGEDAKIVFFDDGGVDQRMNGICAGGTGAFIDQMAALLQTDAAGLDALAEKHTRIYPIAARCGVFAKSDIQPLINEGAAKSDLAASIFQAVVTQTVSGLACGHKIKGNVAFLGGPLFFLSQLRKCFVETLKLSEEQVIFPENAHMFAAAGAAVYGRRQEICSLPELMERLDKSEPAAAENHRLPRLFEDERDYERFVERQSRNRLEKGDLRDYAGDCFLGIDAGSTTSKVALISEEGKLLYSFYGNNQGDPVSTIRKAFREIKDLMNPQTRIRWSCSTGYGEALLKEALNLDEGEVETIAHYYAARYFEPDVDCILDIGGQDMKYIRIADGSIDSIILNEACSSGCGSFIENFANSLGYTAEEFAARAVQAKQPVDLGTRCTVFMNSNVKQAQKEGAAVEDIAAGLACSVVRNALFKVIKLTDASRLGEKIVVQGGTFYNDAVLRSLELIIGREAVRPDIAGIMGAFGAALIAKERCGRRMSGMISIDDVIGLECRTSMIRCQGCLNHCALTVNQFSNGNRYITGNRCENGNLSEVKNRDVPNLFEYKKKRLFDYEPLPSGDAYRGTIGIPRVLNMYENYPFWAVFFRKLGFRTVLSPFSSREIFDAGMDSIPSESECYPAKMAHGHVQWLINAGIKTVFYPCVVYEREENRQAQNNFNCPMVMSYPENIRNNIDEICSGTVRFIDPFMSFAGEAVLTKRLCQIMREEFGIDGAEVREAVSAAWAELEKFHADVTEEGQRALNWMEACGREGIVLAGRPYHLDPEINHGIPEFIQSCGYAVLTEDSMAAFSDTNVGLRSTNQWVYHCRLYDAAQYICSRKDLNLVQLNSFGCGLDAVTTDQVQEILRQAGKPYTLLKIDEISNLGAAKIRLRSLFAALKLKQKCQDMKKQVLKDYRRAVYTEKMRKDGYTILATEMTSPHFGFIRAAAGSCGYNIELLKDEGQSVIDMGMKYVNNDACLPAMITTGQVMEAVLSGRYDTDRLAVMMVQTGGGCRASNYVGFIRKALDETGYSHIPVISLNLNGMEKNPGFRLTPKLLIKSVQSLIYGDLLMKLSCRTRPYEIEAGSTDRLYDSWVRKCEDELARSSLRRSGFRHNCVEMIRQFDRIPVNREKKKPRVGIVGEVLVKFMPLANNHLAELLEKEGAEVVVPDMVEFLKYCIWNSVYKCRYLGKPRIGALAARLGLAAVDCIQGPAFKALEQSRNFDRPAKLTKIRKKAAEIIQIGNQCGEGWFLAGEIAELAGADVNNVVCVQPFGCLPNHVVGKGIIKKVKNLYPLVNIVAVDYDPSASRVNQLNRIKLMLETAKGRI